MIFYVDKQYGFYEFFNEDNGTLLRSDANGKEPTTRSYPELIDVGVMGHCDSWRVCKNAGVDCYQKGKNLRPHMKTVDFERIVKESEGKTFQIALGGAGDANKHPHFEVLLQLCREHRIVPNLTTSGTNLLDEEIELIHQYCGAVAVSWYSRLKGEREDNPQTIRAIDRLVESGCTTNIHFVVSKETIDEAILRLETDAFPYGTKAVIFLLYKPVGLGVEEKTLTATDQRLRQFFRLVALKHPYQIGFDTCFVSGIVCNSAVVAVESIDACEAGTFSMYIDSEMNCYPCSFGIWMKGMKVPLSNSIEEVWNGDVFRRVREIKKCHGCRHISVCRHGCKLGLNIHLCREEMPL